ncbi:MAG: hypothetical protein EA408_03205 [Marinilabiliales bacterium]|nr:MAG: hypothetical protein EA408_03205 [Marinilabiliales bacterium]
MTFLQAPQETYAGNSAKRHIGFGGGWQAGGLRDRGISPLYYSGHYGLAQAGYYYISDSTLAGISTNFSWGRIIPAIYPGPDGSEIISIRGSLDFQLLRYAGTLTGEKIRLHAGGTMTSNIGFYEHNNLMNSAKKNYSFSTLNVTGSISDAINIMGRDFMVSFTASIPVISFIVRPSQSYIKPEGFLDHNTGNIRSFFSSIEIASLNRFAGAVTETAIERTLSSGNKIQLGYKWQYFSHMNENRLESAMHGISIKTFFSL